MPDNRAERARRNERRLDEASNGRNRSSMVMGWVGAEMKRENQFADLGYADEKAFWTSKGYCRSTWYKMIRIAEAFAFASEEEFLAMKVECADMLSYVDAEHRYEPDLLTAAITISIEKFADMIAEHSAVLNNRPKSEAAVEMNFHLKKTQRVAIRIGLAEWMRDHNVKDEGYALEMLVAEYTGRLTLVGYYQESIGRLERAAEHCGLPDVRDELLSMGRDMQEALMIVIGEKRAMQLVA